MTSLAGASALLVMVALVATACVSVSEPVASQPTPEIIYVTPGAPTPTPDDMPTARPRPTPEFVTPAPPEAALDEGWIDYLFWMLDASSGLIERIDAMPDDVFGARFESWSEGMTAFADENSRWLDDNPPSTCYAPHHDIMVRIWAQTADYTGDTLYAVQTYDIPLLERALADQGDVIDLMDEATLIFEDLDCG